MSRRLSPISPYARSAKSIGLLGIKVIHPEDLGPAWDQALASDRPVVLEAVPDPEVPPLPPHISFDQAVHFSKAIWKGDPNRWSMIKGSVKKIFKG